MDNKGKGDDAIIMNIGKMSKLSTQSMRPHYEVGRGSSFDDRVYTIVADMMERTFTIKNQQDEVVAQVAKTVKALIQTAAFGSGTESTIDIAPGVDCSTILAIVYGLGQVGSHFVKDAANNYVLDPIKDSVVGGAVNSVGLGGMAASYTKISNQAVQSSQKVAGLQNFFNNTFK